MRDLELSPLDSVEFENGVFTFKGKLEEPEMLYIKVNDEQDLLRVFAENKDMTINASGGEFSRAAVTGSALNDQMMNFANMYRQKRQMISSAFNLYEGSRVSGDTVGLGQKLNMYKNAQRDFHQFLKDNIGNNRDNVLGPYITVRYMASRMTISQLDSLMEEFSEVANSSRYE